MIQEDLEASKGLAGKFMKKSGLDGAAMKAAFKEGFLSSIWLKMCLQGNSSIEALQTHVLGLN